MNKKKSFTLVELLVVIAILGILSTIGVVGFSSFKEKAAVTSDKYYINGVNTLLKNQTDVNIKTVNDVYYVLALDGDTLEQPQSKHNRYVFDSYTKSILYVDENDNVLNHKHPGDKEYWYELDYEVVLVEDSSTSTYDDLFK